MSSSSSSSQVKLHEVEAGNYAWLLSEVEDHVLQGRQVPSVSFGSCQSAVEEFAVMQFPMLPRQFEVLSVLDGCINAAIGDLLCPADGVDVAAGEKARQNAETAFRFCMFVLALIDHNCIDHGLNVAWSFKNLSKFHDSLMQFDSDRFGLLQHSIAMVCENYVLKEMTDSAELLPQTVCFLLMFALRSEAKVADVKRVHQLRNAFKLFDYDDASSDGIKQLLMHAMMNTLFLRTSDGKKFCTFILQLGGEVTEYAHAVVKTHIPGASKTQLSALGDIYFKAWKNSDENVRNQIEYACIQDFMNHAVHAQRKGSSKLSPFTRISTILEHFHSQKKVAGVDEMLYRLYAPILWRSLNVANADVRCNAVSLMIDAFPIQNPGAGPEETSELLQRQFDNLMMLLKDDSPSVRAISARGLCKVFAIYWEVIPSQVLGDMLQILAVDLAVDSSSAEVRLAVIEGFKFLIENTPASHTAMRRYLKKIGKLIHDSNPKNREAFLDLLLVVKALPDIKFWDVTDIDHLLYRLEFDSAAIGERIVILLQNSFMPLKKDAATQLSRALVLLDKNFGAARKFYLLASRKVAADKQIGFVEHLYETLHAHAPVPSKKPGKKSKKRLSKGDDDTTETIDDAKLEQLIDILAILVHNMVAANNDMAQQRLVTAFERHSLANLIPACKTSLGLAAIFDIAKHALASNIVEIAPKFEDVLYVGSAATSVQKAVLQCIFNWGGGPELIDDFLTSLESVVDVEMGDGSKSKIEDHHFLVVEYVHFLLVDERYRRALIADGVEKRFDCLFDAVADRWTAMARNVHQSSDTKRSTESEFILALLQLAHSWHVHCCVVDNEDPMNKIRMNEYQGKLIDSLPATEEFWQIISPSTSSESMGAKRSCDVSNTIGDTASAILSNAVETMALGLSGPHVIIKFTSLLTKLLSDGGEGAFDSVAGSLMAGAVEELMFSHIRSRVSPSTTHDGIQLSDLKQIIQHFTTTCHTENRNDENSNHENRNNENNGDVHRAMTKYAHYLSDTDRHALSL